MDYSARHLRLGWWSLLAFTALGFTLEILHAFKIGAYVDVANDTRRLMWTLAHAHGTLLGIVHVIFGIMLRVQTTPQTAVLRIASVSLVAASVLLPAGFFAGGIGFYGGDPGVAALLLIPTGATALLGAFAGIARISGGSDIQLNAGRSAPARSKAATRRS